MTCSNCTSELRAVLKFNLSLKTNYLFDDEVMKREEKKGRKTNFFAFRKFYVLEKCSNSRFGKALRIKP